MIDLIKFKQNTVISSLNSLDVRPVVCIPVAMKDKVKAELDRMQELGVITPVSEPTDWVSYMVATNKKDKQ